MGSISMAMSSLSRFVCVVLFAGGVTGLVPDHVSAGPAGQCFEVIAAQSDVEPKSPILVDKCTGRSWVLLRADKGSRTGRATYRWSPVPVDKPSTVSAPVPVTPAPSAATSAKPSEKCFTFQGRQFCE